VFLSAHSDQFKSHASKLKNYCFSGDELAVKSSLYTKGAHVHLNPRMVVLYKSASSWWIGT